MSYSLTDTCHGYLDNELHILFMSKITKLIFFSFYRRKGVVMSKINQTQSHEYYTQTPRHWCALSETITGGDSLLTALEQGWIIEGEILREIVLFRGSRTSEVFHFTLSKAGQMRVMTVTSNPFVVRLVAEHEMSVINFTDLPDYIGAEEPLLKFA